MRLVGVLWEISASQLGAEAQGQAGDVLHGRLQMWEFVGWDDPAVGVCRMGTLRWEVSECPQSREACPEPGWVVDL